MKRLSSLPNWALAGLAGLAVLAVLWVLGVLAVVVTVRHALRVMSIASSEGLTRVLSI